MDTIDKNAAASHPTQQAGNPFETLPTTSPTMTALGPGTRPADKSDPAIQQQLTELTTALVKGITQTNYYSPDHPVAKKTALQAFKALKQFEERFLEVSYTLQTSGETEELFIEGIFAELVPLANLIRSPMAAQFAAKLKTYFQRNRIAALTLKTHIEEDEFDRFISVFVERHLEGTKGETRPESFSHELLGRDVQSVKVVHERDILGAKRKMPWHVRMAISRLRKDLNEVPLYAKASRQELKAAKLLLIQDIIRPLRRTKLIRELLINSDLVAIDVPELADADIESDIINSLARELLLTVAWSFVSDLETLAHKSASQSPEETRPDLHEAVKNILRKMALRLTTEESARGREMLLHLFKRELLVFEELPENLQQQLKAEQSATEFLAHRDMVFAQLDQDGNLQVYLDQLSRMSSIFNELLRRRCYSDTHRFLVILDTQRQCPSEKVPDRDKYIAQVFKQLQSEETIKLLVNGMELAKRDERLRIRDMLIIIGEPALPSLLQLLEAAENSAVRQACTSSIAAMGKAALPRIIAELRRSHRNSGYARHLLTVLGEIKDDEAIAELIHFASHPHPKLREEALVALHKVRGAGAESQLIAALGDEHHSVRRRALVLLDQIESKRPELSDHLAKLLRPRDSKEEEPAEQLQDIAIGIIARLGPAPLTGGGTLEDVLIEVLGGCRRSLFARVVSMRKSRRKSGPLRAAACAALGTIGSAGAEAVLENARRDRDTEVANQAAAALDNLRQRLA